jgi:hypothetical protein
LEHAEIFSNRCPRIELCKNRELRSAFIAARFNSSLSVTLVDLPRLEWLTLNADIPSQELTRLGELKSLRKLLLHVRSIDAPVLRAIAQLPAIEELHIGTIEEMNIEPLAEAAWINRSRIQISGPHANSLETRLKQLAPGAEVRSTPDDRDFYYGFYD